MSQEDHQTSDYFSQLHSRLEKTGEYDALLNAFRAKIENEGLGVVTDGNLIGELSSRVESGDMDYPLVAEITALTGAAIRVGYNDYFAKSKWIGVLQTAATEVREKMDRI